LPPSYFAVIEQPVIPYECGLRAGGREDESEVAFGIVSVSVPALVRLSW